MITIHHLDAAESCAQVAELKSVYLAVFSLPPYNEGPEMGDAFAGWLADEARRPGFDMVVAREPGRLVGFAYGYTQPPGQWWRRTDRPAPAHVKAAEKFAVMEWAVLPARRRNGIGKLLLDELLANRAGPYATLTVNPAADARAIYERWGWHRVASTRAGRMPAMDVMVLSLPDSRGSAAQPDSARPDGARPVSGGGTPGTAPSRRRPAAS